MTYIICNADSEPISEYDELAMAKEACRDLAREAAQSGDPTNHYYIHDVADFEGYAAKDFHEAS